MVKDREREYKKIRKEGTKTIKRKKSDSKKWWMKWKMKQKQCQAVSARKKAEQETTNNRKYRK